MAEWVAVCAEENAEAVEIPTEQDGSLLLSSVTAQFPGATGLKFRNPDTNTLRGVRLQDGEMAPPTENGWGMHTYIVVREARDNRKRNASGDAGGAVKNHRGEEIDPTQPRDLIILGLSWKAKEKDVKDYFEAFGEVTWCQIKTKPGTDESKGFGFVKFAEKEVEKKVLLQRHMIDGRWCDVKVPEARESRAEQGFAGPTDKSLCKVFVGRITEDMTKDDLLKHFEAFGQVTDVYIPTPFRKFAFVQFAEAHSAQALHGKDHIIKGTTVKVCEAAPKGPGAPGAGGGGHGPDKYGGFSPSGLPNYWGGMGSWSAPPDSFREEWARYEAYRAMMDKKGPSSNYGYGGFVPPTPDQAKSYSSSSNGASRYESRESRFDRRY